MSQYHNRLSANRGQCLQECRRKYKLTDIEDPRREFIVDGNYMMSPKDLCALPVLGELIKAGIDVLKIEGRAKGPEYVYTVTKVYREALTLLEKNKFSKEEMVRLTQELDKVFNRGFSTNFYLGTPTNDSWNRFYGSSAQEKKVKLGKVMHYYSKLSVVSIKVEENGIKENDLICFIGPTTGYSTTKVQGLRVDNKLIERAGPGQEVSFKVQEKVRPEDRVYLIQERDIDKEEKRIQDQLQPIGIHTPFKQTKQKGMS
jgi:putative protease